MDDITDSAIGPFLTLRTSVCVLCVYVWAHECIANTKSTSLFIHELWFFRNKMRFLSMCFVLILSTWFSRFPILFLLLSIVYWHNTDSRFGCVCAIFLLHDFHSLNLLSCKTIKYPWMDQNICFFETFLMKMLGQNSHFAKRWRSEKKKSRNESSWFLLQKIL